MPMVQDAYGRWVNSDTPAGGGVQPNTGYWNGDTGTPNQTYAPPPPDNGYGTTGQGINERAGYDVAAWNSLPPWQQQRYIQGGGAPGQQQQVQRPGQQQPAYNGGSSVEELTKYFAQAGPADGDPAYWARVAAEKIGKGANPQETLQYLTGRADFKQLGGSGGPSSFGGGGMGNYTPMGPMNYGEQAQWGGYNAPSYTQASAYQAGTPFSSAALKTPDAYQRQDIQGPNAFAFPGVYQAPKSAAPGGWNEQAYLAANPDVAKAVQEGWMPSGQAHYQQFGKNENRNLGSNLAGQEGDGTNLQPGQTPYNAYTPASPFSYESSPESYTGAAPMAGFSARGQIAAPTPFGPPSTLQTPGQYQGQGAFAYGHDVPMPEGYTPGTFKPPTEEELKEDPSYQFRVKEALGRLQSSAAAKGLLRSGQTWDALQRQAEEMASQEYSANYGRRFNEFQQSEASRANAYNMNTGYGLQAQQQGYGQAANTFGLNEQNQLAAYQTNAQTQMAAQAQQYGQAAQTYGMNTDNDFRAQQASFGNQLAGYQADTSTQAQNEAQRMAAYNANLAAQAQGYGQAANTQQMNEQQRMAAYQANQAAQNQAYGQAFQQNQANFENQFNVDQANQNLAQSAYGLNAQTQLGYQNQQYNQAYNTWAGNEQNAANAWQMNAGQQLNEYQAMANAGLGAAQLNQQGQFGAYDRNYNAAWNDYQSQVQQGQYGAGLGYQYAGLGQNAYQFDQNYGLQSNAQNFNQGLATDQWNYQTQYADPWNRAYQTANLGYGGAQGAANNAYNYANNAGDLYGTSASAYGAGRVGSANAYANAFGNVGANIGGSLIYSAYNQPSTTQQRPTSTGAPANPYAPWSPSTQRYPQSGYGGYSYTPPNGNTNT